MLMRFEHEIIEWSFEKPISTRL